MMDSERVLFHCLPSYISVGETAYVIFCLFIFFGSLDGCNPVVSQCYLILLCLGPLKNY